jgi:hypothetical protein
MVAKAKLSSSETYIKLRNRRFGMMETLILPADLKARFEKSAREKGFRTVEEYLIDLMERALLQHAKNRGEKI